MPTISELFVKLGVDPKDANKAIRSFEKQTTKSFKKVGKEAGFLQSSFKKIAIAAAGFFSARAIGGAIRGTLDLADQIGKLNQRLGISTETLSKLRFAGEQSGIGFSALAVGLQRATRRLEEFRTTGRGSAAGAIEALGLAAAVRSGETLERLLPRMADAFRSMGSEAERVRTAFQLFDTEGVAFVQLLGQGNEEMQKLFTEAERLGVVFSKDLADSAAKVNDEWAKIKFAIEGALIAATELVLLRNPVRMQAERFGIGRFRPPSVFEPDFPEPFDPTQLQREQASQLQAMQGLLADVRASLAEMFSEMETGAANAPAALEPMTTAWQEWAEQIQVTARDVMASIDGVVSGFSSSIGQAIANVAVQGADFAEQMRNVIRNLFSMIIQQIVQMIVKMLILRAVMALFGLGGGGAGIPTGTLGAGITGFNPGSDVSPIFPTGGGSAVAVVQINGIEVGRAVFDQLHKVAAERGVNIF